MRIRSIFLFRTLCEESSTASLFFYEKGALTEIAHQLDNLQDPEIREHLLFAGAAFLTSLQGDRRIQALETVPDLRNTVQKVFDLSKQEIHYEFDLTDTKSICKELLHMIDSLQKK